MNFGAAALTMPLCFMFQTTLIILTFFTNCTQRSQVYCMLKLSKMKLSFDGCQFDLESEKNSLKRSYNRSINFKRETTNYFLFFLSIIRQFILNGPSDLIDQSIQLFKTGSSEAFSKLSSVSKSMIEGLSLSLINLILSLILISIIGCDHLFLNLIGKPINTTTLLAQVQPLVQVLTNLKVSMRDIRLNLTSQVRCLFVLYGLLVD